MRKVLVCVVVLLLISPPVAGASAVKSAREGSVRFKEQDYAGAVAKYEEALKNDPESAKINFNLGTSLYKAGDYDTAAEHLQQALLTDDPDLLARARFNLGNTHYQRGRLQEDQDIAAAIAELERSLNYYEPLLEAPDPDPDAIANQALIEQELQRLREKQEEQKRQQQDQKQNQDQGQEQNQGQSSSKNSSSAQPQNGAGEEQNPSPDASQEDGTSKSPEEHPSPSGQGTPQEESPSSSAGDGQDSSGEKEPASPQAGQPDEGEGARQGAGTSGDPSDRRQAAGSAAVGAADGTELTEDEARMLMNDFENTEGVQRMFFLVPRGARDESPVGKDW